MTSLRPSSLLLLAGLTATALVGCEPTLDEAPAVSAGSLDLSRVVAIGDDYAAGVADGGLTRARQEYSFPNLLVQQLQRAGAGAFTQPLLATGESTGGVQLLSLTATNQALTGPAAVSFIDQEPLNPGTPCEEIRYRLPAWADAGAGLPGNLAVPGLRLMDLETPGLGDETNFRNAGAAYNAGLERILPDGADAASYLTLVKRAQPTFVIVSAGLGDLLPYILSGGTCNTSLPSVSTVSFRAKRLVDSLVATTSANGIILGVPKLDVLPLTRTTVSAVSRGLGRPDTASLYGIVFRNNKNDTVRLSYEDIVLLPMVARVGRMEDATGTPYPQAFGSRENPLRDRDVLTTTEIARVDGYINAPPSSINDRLRTAVSIAGAKGRFVYVETGNFFQSLNNGQFINGIRFSDDPVTGGLVSLDGYTLTPRGNALLVNFIITNALNPLSTVSNFGTSLPLIDISTLPATRLP